MNLCAPKRLSTKVFVITSRFTQIRHTIHRDNWAVRQIEVWKTVSFGDRCNYRIGRTCSGEKISLVKTRMGLNPCDLFRTETYIPSAVISG